MGIIKPEIEGMHWEHGYRCHGLWLGINRLGRVSIGPRRLWDGIYRWELDGFPATSGEAETLRKAKRQVEEALLAAQKDRDSRSTGRINEALRALRPRKHPRRRLTH